MSGEKNVGDSDGEEENLMGKRIESEVDDGTDAAENETARLHLLESLPKDLEQAKKIRSTWDKAGITEMKGWDIELIDAYIEVIEETLKLARAQGKEERI